MDGLVSCSGDKINMMIKEKRTSCQVPGFSGWIDDGVLY